MTIRTNKMLAARTDHYGPSCKLWFPCNEGSGNTITDLIAGVVIPDAATAEHNEPHAISLLTAVGVTGTGISGLQIPAVGMALAVFKAHAITILSTITLGAASTTGILLGTASNSISTNSNMESNAPVTAVNAGDYIIHAIAWDATHAYTYFDAAATKAAIAVTLEASGAMNAAVAAGLPRNFDNSVTISSVNPIDLFGLALFDFGTALPSDLLTGIQTMSANWLKGEKTLYAPWADL